MKSTKYHLHLKLVIIILCMIPSGLFAQTEFIDSLKKMVPNSKDTSRLKIVNLIIENSINEDEWSGYNLEMAKIAIELLHNKNDLIKLHAVKAAGDYFNNLAYLDQLHSKNDKALKNYQKSLEIKKLIRDSTGSAITLCNMGLIFSDQGNIEKALEFMYGSLQLSEQCDFAEGIMNAYNSIGNTFYHQNEFAKSIDYYRKSLSLAYKFGGPAELGGTFNNIAVSFQNLSQYDSSIYYYEKCAKLTHESNNFYGLAIVYDNIGCDFIHKKEFSKAHAALDSSLKYSLSEGFEETSAITYHNKITAFLKTNDINKANEYSKKEMELALKLGTPKLLMNAYYDAFEINKILGNHKAALSHHQNYVLMKDSISNINSKRALIKNQLKYDYEKKEAVLKAEQEKRNLINAEEKRKHEIIIIFISVGLLLVAILALVILRSLRVNKNKNAIITRQKTEVEHQRDLIEKQKETLEEHQKEILDSIHYAKRIQTALMPSDKMFSKNLNRLKSK